VPVDRAYLVHPPGTAYVVALRGGRGESGLITRRVTTVVTGVVATAVAGGLLLGAPVPAAADRGDDSAVSTPSEDPYYPAKGDPSVDALHYGLRLHWSPRTRVLTGRARIRFRAPVAESRIQLDLGKALAVRRVTVDGARRTFSHRGKNLVVQTGALTADSRHTLVVAYRGVPKPVRAPSTRRDIRRVGWTTTARGEVWTMQEPFGAFTWYPVNDHPSDKARYDVRVSVPRGMVGVVNGRMTGRRTAGGRTVTQWHLDSPAASYLTTIAIGDYVRYRDRGPHGLPLTYWLPRRDQRALPELRRSPQLIRWLERRLGPYPFDRLGVVLVPSPSAMETQTLVTMGSPLIANRRDFRAVLLHEYAHQWYGDLVTPDNWPDLWMNEAFAMYLQFRWEASRGGFTMDEVRAVLTERDPALRRKDGPPGAFHRDRFAELCVYHCGALMLDRMNSLLGPDLFGQVLREWPRQHAQQSVDRNDYISWLSERTGRDMGPFVTEWLTSPTTPT
jgi:aminopeptidase N